MRAVGTLLSFLCGLIAVGILWVGYIGVFDETQVIPDFESTPREGWDYWMRLEFWHDFRSYALWILLAFGGVLIPAFGLIRSGRPTTQRKVSDWILICLSALYVCLWSWGTAAAFRRPELDLVLIPPVIMFSGSLYGLLVFWLRTRHRIKEEAQQAAT
jgi:hypothetical protein